MNREVHVRFCEGLGCNSLGLLTATCARDYRDSGGSRWRRPRTRASSFASPGD